MVRQIKVASGYFPASWVRSGNTLGKIIVKASPELRGSYVFDVNRMTGHLYLDGSFGSAIHEYSHWLQTAMPDLDDYFQQLHVARTAGDKHERIRDLKGVRYDKRELTKKDQYIDPYMGKEYPYDIVPYSTRARAMELMTTAYELFFDNNPDFINSYLQHDPELLKLILGTLTKYEP